eukprot:jgi/Hompol1/865/HPOL_002584-RA
MVLPVACLKRLNLAPDHLLRLLDALVTEQPIGPSATLRRITDAVSVAMSDLEMLRLHANNKIEAITTAADPKGSLHHSQVSVNAYAAAQSAAAAESHPVPAAFEQRQRRASRTSLPSSNTGSHSTRSSASTGPTNATTENQTTAPASILLAPPQKLRRSTSAVLYPSSTNTSLQPLHEASSPATQDRLPPSNQLSARHVQIVTEPLCTPQTQSIRQPTSKTLYLKHGKTVKKITWHKTSIDEISIKRVFASTFPETRTDAPDYDVYIKDPGHGEFYLVEDYGDVQDGSVLRLVPLRDTAVAETESVDKASLQQLQSQMDSMIQALSRLQVDIADIKSHQPVAQPVDQSAVQTNGLPQQTDIMPATQCDPKEAKPDLFCGMDGFKDLLDLSFGVTESSLKRSGSATQVMAEPVKSQTAEAATQTSRQIDMVHMRQAVLQLRSDHQTTKQNMVDLASTFQQSIRDTANLLIDTWTIHQDQSDNAISRAPLHASLDRIADQAEELEHRISIIHQVLDMDCIDITRGARPSDTKLLYTRNNVSSLGKDITAFSQRITTAKATCKSVWERELSRIVGEQAFVKEQQEFASRLSAQHVEICTLFGNVNQVIDVLKSRDASKTTVAKDAVKMHVLDADEAKTVGMRNVLTELSMRASDLGNLSEKRIEALDRMQTAHQFVIEAHTSKSPFEKELLAFVQCIGLRRPKDGSSGIAMIEQERERRNNELIQMMYRDRKSGQAASISLETSNNTNNTDISYSSCDEA